MTVTLLAQTTLTFVGRDRTGNDYVRLSSVSVYDLDQLWHQIIEYPDTTLVLYVNGTVGVETMCTSSLQMQNNPNPFDGATDVILCTPYDGDVTMEIADVNGRAVVGANDYSPLPTGTHQFRLTLSAPGTYVLTARQNGRTVSVKMVNAGNGGGDGIEYMGVVETTHALSLQPKSNTRGDGHYPFHNWDRMRYTGYAVVDDVEIESETVEKAQNGSETIPLKFDVARPEVVTNDATDIAATVATLHGEVTADNNALVTERGFCYGTAPSPTYSSSPRVEAGNGLGTFDATLNGLAAATTYYTRAYAKNVVGVSYGTSKAFRTNDTLPEVVTTEPDQVTATSFVSGGNVLAANGAAVTTRGICWSTEQNPTTADSHTTLTGGLGSFTSNVTGLDCGTTYYVRAYATNSVGTAYGEEISVTTLPHSIPEVRLAMSNIYNGLNIATQAEVLTENCSAVTERGVCWSTSHNPTLEDSHTVNGEGIGVFNDTLTNLEIATNYYIRAYATNELGTAYSEEAQVVTSDYPTVTTSSVINITATTATSGGSVTSDGGAIVTARGVCWSTTPNPTIADSYTTDGNGTGSFTSSLTGLTANTTYYVRAYATNSVGIAYGDEVCFATLYDACQGVTTLTDIDGNTYNTVQIGSQCWMKENLRTTKYADGTSISQGSSTSTTTAYWYYPNNDASNKTTYGLLYNWTAVMRNSSSSSANPSGVQGICPTGWHVPSDAEWKQMEMAVGMSQSDADNTGYRGTIAAKLSGNTGWTSSSTTNAAGNLSASGRNSSGFSALPAGYFSYNYFGDCAYFWSATESASSSAWRRRLSYNNAGVSRTNGTKDYGYSVRCLRD